MVVNHRIGKGTSRAIDDNDEDDDDDEEEVGEENKKKKKKEERRRRGGTREVLSCRCKLLLFHSIVFHLATALHKFHFRFVCYKLNTQQMANSEK